MNPELHVAKERFAVRERFDDATKHVEDNGDAKYHGYDYVITIGERVFRLRIFDENRQVVLMGSASALHYPEFRQLVDYVVEVLDCPIIDAFSDQLGVYMAIDNETLDFVVPFENVGGNWEDTPTYRCPCCRNRTLHSRGHYECCSVCWWEDDGQDDHDADEVRGGPNGALSLTQGRKNFQEYHASDVHLIPHVRPPTTDEL